MVHKAAQEFFDMGSKFHDLGGLDQALTYYLKALNYLRNTDEYKMRGDALLEIGNIYIELKDLDNGRKYYEKSLIEYKKAEDEIGEAYSFTGIGLIHEKRGKYADAREFYHEALKKFEGKNDTEREAVIYSLLAGTYESQGAWEDAIMEYKKSSSLFAKIGEKDRKDDVGKLIHDINIKRSKTKTTSNEKLFAVGYLLALILAELCVTFVSKEVGLVIETVILFVLLANSSWDVSYNYSVMLRSMMALPMIRIIGLSIPLMQIQPLYWFPIIAIPLFAATYTIMRSQGLTKEHIGLIWGNKTVQFFIALTGIFLGIIEFTILQPKPLIAVFNPLNLIAASLILIVSTGLAEELLFRGILQKNAENVFGTILGLIYTALLFTALHIGWDSFLDLIFVFTVAMFYGYMFQKTRSIVGITLSHGISNSFLFLVMPFYAPLILHLLRIS